MRASPKVLSVRTSTAKLLAYILTKYFDAPQPHILVYRCVYIHVRPNLTASGEKRPLTDLVRPNIQDLTPYRCARDDYSDGVLLDANENSFGPALVAGQVNMECIRSITTTYAVESSTWFGVSTCSDGCCSMNQGINQFSRVPSATHQHF